MIAVAKLSEQQARLHPCNCSLKVLHTPSFFADSFSTFTALTRRQRLGAVTGQQRRREDTGALAILPRIIADIVGDKFAEYNSQLGHLTEAPLSGLGNGGNVCCCA